MTTAPPRPVGSLVDYSSGIYIPRSGHGGGIAEGIWIYPKGFAPRHRFAFVSLLSPFWEAFAALVASLALLWASLALLWAALGPLRRKVPSSRLFPPPESVFGLHRRGRIA